MGGVPIPVVFQSRGAAAHGGVWGLGGGPHPYSNPELWGCSTWGVWGCGGVPIPVVFQSRGAVTYGGVVGGGI